LERFESKALTKFREAALTNHRSLICFALALAPTLLTPTAPVRADETFAPVAVISLPGGQLIQSFDISFVDPVTGIYVLGDRTNKAVDVIDTTTTAVLTALKLHKPWLRAHPRIAPTSWRTVRGRTSRDSITGV